MQEGLLNHSCTSIWKINVSRGQTRSGWGVGKGKRQRMWMRGSRLLEEGGVEGLHVGVHSDWETSDDIEMCPVGSTTEFVAETLLPTRHGKLRLRGYRHTVDGRPGFSEPTAMICGAVEGCSDVPVRVHDACFTSEVLGSLKCDCAAQLELALDYIQENPPGMVIYLQQEGRGIGLANKIAAYALQEKGLDTVDANRALGLPDDCREYTPVLSILEDLQIKSIKLMTNNPRKIDILRDLGIAITGRIPCIVEAGEYSKNYLEVKEKRMNHMLEGEWCYWDHEGEPARRSTEVSHLRESYPHPPPPGSDGNFEKDI